MKWLVVDDHPRIRSFLKQLLYRPEDDWKECGDGSEVLMVVENYRPDWILMDVEMPLQDGITTTQQICSLITDQKIIIISQHDDLELKSAAIQAGAQKYFLKSELHLLPGYLEI